MSWKILVKHTNCVHREEYNECHHPKRPMRDFEYAKCKQSSCPIRERKEASQPKEGGQRAMVTTVMKKGTALLEWEPLRIMDKPLSATFLCPCREIHAILTYSLDNEVSRPHHTINDNGIVFPSVVCPRGKFHASVRLQDWNSDKEASQPKEGDAR